MRRLSNGNVAHGCEACDGEDECTCGSRTNTGSATPTTLTPARIAELLAICAKATDGPWRNSPYETPQHITFAILRDPATYGRFVIGNTACREDAVFAVAARTALPDALRDITASQEALAKVTAERDAWQSRAEDMTVRAAKYSVERDESRANFDLHVAWASDQLAACESENAALREAEERAAKVAVMAAIPLEAVNAAGGFYGYSREVNVAMRDAMLAIREMLDARAALAKDPAP